MILWIELFSLVRASDGYWWNRVMNAHVRVGGTFLKSWQFVGSQVEQRSDGLVSCGLCIIEFLSFEFYYRKFNYSFENTQKVTLTVTRDIKRFFIQFVAMEKKKNYYIFCMFVYMCASVALVIQHAKCMRRIVICALSGCTIFLQIVPLTTQFS